MIVSHRHRYVFVALPRTGSTAVEKELLASYDGERVMKKHSTYGDFLRRASSEERSYFAFSSIRNPLDDAVSRYFKISTDHNQRYSDATRRRYRVGNRGAEAVRRTGLNARGRLPARRSIIERIENRQFDFLQRTGAGFAEYFRRYYFVPHDTWARLDHDRLDFVIRFESLEKDFDTVLSELGIAKVRPLPVKNRTSSKSDDFLNYYTDDLVPRAKWVFGPYIRRWGYEFPESWDEEDHQVLADLVFNALSIPRRMYWRIIR